MTGTLDRLLRPRSVAVIGGGAWCAKVVGACIATGFDGPVWSVHPARGSVGGLPAVPRIEDLPGVPDAVFVGINRAAAVEAVAALSAMGAGGAVVFASGFAEATAELPDGADLQARLVAAAGAMPILGPNCYGLINALDGAALWPDVHGLVRTGRGVAILSQSSNIALNLTMQMRGLPIAYVVTPGNQAQTGLAALGRAVLEDDRVTALGLYLEGVGDLRAFEALAAEARARGKRIVALKVGASALAQAATVSHTASLAGSDAGAQALMDRLGVARVRSLGALVEALKLCHFGAVPTSSRLVCLSSSGGEASLIADTALAHDVAFPPLTAAQRAGLRAALGPRVALANPLDYHTYIWADVAGMTDCFAAALDADIGLGLVVVDFPRADRCIAPDWDCVIDAGAAARRRGTVPLGLLASLPDTMPEPVAQRIAAAGLVPLCGFPEVLEAVAALVRAAGADAAPPLCRAAAAGPAETLDEGRAKPLLAAHGLSVPRGVSAQSAEAIAWGADDLRFPVALKGLGVAHKSEAGLVALNLPDAAAVADAAAAMPASRFHAEEMVTGGIAELLVGVTADPAHGLVLTLGAGGVLAELLDDTVSRLLPVTPAQIDAALDGLRVARLLGGWRGAPAADRAAIRAAILAVARFAEAEAHRIYEVEVNPLVCTPERAVAVDALIRWAVPR